MAQLAAPAPLSTLARLKIDAELVSLSRKRSTLTPGMPMFAFNVARLGSKIIALLRQRGTDLNGQARENKAFAGDGAPELPAKPRVATGHLYDFDPNRKHGERKKDNKAAMALLDMVNSGQISADALTDAQKQALAKYSGTGGNLIGADGKAGSAYEYYTPKPIAEGMWAMLGELGFKGGKVLDPCSGVGIFGASAPGNVAMESVELNETSGRINQLVNGGDGYNAIVAPFEAVASRTADEIYDAVISNVPFGGVHDRGSNRKIDPKYQDQPLETYFILRSLEKLKPGGLAAFIVPPRVVSAKGGREEQLRIAASYMAEFMGAYRLPNSVFGTADADTITDVIVLRKFGRDAALKIEELRAQNPGALIEANVLWQEFTDGRYFQGEGKRFVLGEFVAKDPSKFRDVDRIVSDQSIPNIAKLLRKFPGSRIDWKALEALETEPIIYNEGDSLTLAGQTLELRNGEWVALGKAPEDDRFDALGPVLTSPLAAVSAKVAWDQARDYVDHLNARSRGLEMPVWLRMATNDIGKAPQGDQARLWNALSAGLATVQVMQAHAGESAFNYLEEYAVLSDAIVASAQTMQKPPTSFSRESKAAFTKARVIYSRKSGFEPIWKGEGAAEVAVGNLDEDAQISALQYTVGKAIDVDALKAIYGANFDVMADDGWCLDATGTKATKADDYYIGNYAEFLAKIDADIAQATGTVRDKLLRQRAAAEARIDKVDPENLRFNLFSPFVTMEEKAEFMRRFMHPAFAVAVNNLGNPYIVYEGPENTTEQQLMSRIASYLSGDAGGRGVRSLSLATKKLGMSDREALAMLRQYATRLNTQFDGWVKANPLITARMNETANDPARLYFTEVDDNTPLAIPGMKPGRTLHGYQNAFVRKQARSFGGINGYDVGLGKSLTSLACTQYVHSIGVKKKTIFVVPNSVLSNWRREADMAYTSIDDCLFIGLEINEKTGKASVKSSNYARDFTRVLENRHRKIFCTLEAFSSIPLRDETIRAYERYLMEIDPSYAGSDKKADDERAESKRADAVGGGGAKSSALPYLEDMGIDSLVSDEAHVFKNGKNTLEFSGAKFLSVAKASQRGMDMQMKAWYVRGLTPSGDGVLPLTATPITNSPLEIYSMLTLAVGEKKVHDLCMGAKGADAFMDTMCMIEDDEDVGIDGTVKSYRVFRGLQNVDLLRGAIAAVATIKTGADVKASGDDLKLPESPETSMAVKLSGNTLERLNEYKMAYRAAKEATGSAGKDAPPVTPEEVAALEKVQARFGEDTELIAHPFNLIQKMTALIADPELDERATFYTILPAQRPQAEAAIAAFNKLGKIEQRARGGPWTDSDAIVGKKTVRDGGGESIILRIKVKAKMTPDGRIVVDTTDYKIQAEFEKQAEKLKLELDCTIPPKLSALLANVKAEEATPRSQSGRVKQLIFCDILSLHNKIKRILTKHAGIAASAIEIISGQSIDNPEQMQGIQDGFNADGEDNLYRAIIANEKAEVGINLQKGTQAIHHLTIGWTPDSQHQRNGRGVRQGNTTARVNIYHYDADGTFDEYKRRLTTAKSDWIGAVMDKQGGNEVQVSGGLTSDQYDELIESMGDATAVQAIQDRASMKERLQRADSARSRQLISLQTAESQQKFVKEFPTAKDWLASQIGIAFDLNEQLRGMNVRDTSKMKSATLIKFETRKAEMQAKLDALLRDIDEAGGFTADGEPFAEILKKSMRGGSNTPTRRANMVRMVYRVKAIATDSALVEEWDSQVKQAEAMANEALKEFTRIGAAGGGAYHPDMVEAFKNGEGTILDGRPYCKGMFIRRADGELLILKDKDAAVRYPDKGAYLADAVRNGTVIGFESPDYDAALTEAAQFDDSQAEVLQWAANRLFSAISPAVAARRKVETLVRYSARDFMLPSPHFPHPVNPKHFDEASEALRDIIRSQQAVIKKWDGNDFFAVSSADITKAPPSYELSAKVVKAIADRARATGQRMTGKDIAILLNLALDYPVQVLAKSEFKFPDSARDRIMAATSLDDLKAIEKALIVEAADWLEVPESWVLTELANTTQYGIVSAYHQTKTRIQALEKAAAEAAFAAATQNRSSRFTSYTAWIEANPGPIPPGMREQIEQDERLEDGEAEIILASVKSVAPEKSGIGDVAVSPKGKIGLTGRTMDHVNINGTRKAVKDFIKLAAESLGGKATWRGDWLQWDVTPEAWEVLCTKYPQAARLLTVCPAVA
jgi:predicted RNA methylase